MQTFNFTEKQIQMILSFAAEFTDPGYLKDIPEGVEIMFHHAMHSCVLESELGETAQKMYYAKTDIIRLMTELKEVVEEEKPKADPAALYEVVDMP